MEVDVITQLERAYLANRDLSAYADAAKGRVQTARDREVEGPLREGLERLLRRIEEDQRVRVAPDAEVVARSFAKFDALYFGSQLSGGTAVTLDPALVDHERGSTKKDGTRIFLAPDDLDWAYTLLHEMVHAFEFRFPGAIEPTPEATRHAAKADPFEVHGSHSPAFFSKLFEIMRLRGHEPKVWYDVYFG